VARRPTSLLLDTDIFIDYLNGIEWARKIINSPYYRVYYQAAEKNSYASLRSIASLQRTGSQSARSKEQGAGSLS
jgi:hypothetical protein